jgi:hypothetical protein
MPSAEPALRKNILRSRGRGGSRALTHTQAEAVVSLLANQYGALQYMIEYERGLRQGAPVRVSPIACVAFEKSCKKGQESCLVAACTHARL